MRQLVRHSLKVAGRLFKLRNSDIYQFLPQRKQVLIPHNFFMVLKLKKTMFLPLTKESVDRLVISIGCFVLLFTKGLNICVKLCL